MFKESSMIRLCVAMLLLMSTLIGIADADTKPNSNTSGFDEIKLVRTECYGWCPVYEVTIHGDGSVEYIGTRFVKTHGNASTKLPKEALGQLVAAVQEVDFFNLRDQYKTEEDGCASVVTDSPSAVMTVVASGQRKVIRQYYGCWSSDADRMPYPAKLVRFAETIDKIVDIEKWIGTRDERFAMQLRGDS